MVAADDSQGGGGVAQRSFALLSLLGGLGDLARGRGLLLHTLDDADRHRLTHVAHCKASWEINGV